MSQIDELADAYERFVSLPWEAAIPSSQRVWMIVYAPTDERRLRARLVRFETATKAAGHGWRVVDVTDPLGRWLGQHPYRETYFASPGKLSSAALAGFDRYVQDEVRAALEGDGVDESTVIAVLGAGGLFPFTR